MEYAEMKVMFWEQFFQTSIFCPSWTEKNFNILKTPIGSEDHLVPGSTLHMSATVELDPPSLN